MRQLTILLLLGVIGSPVRGEFYEADGQVSFEAEAYTRVYQQENHRWEVRRDFPDASGGACVCAVPDIGSNINTAVFTSSPRLSYTVYFKRTGTYNVWVRGFGEPESDSVLVTLDDQVPEQWNRVSWWPASAVFSWTNGNMSGGAASVVVREPGEHRIVVWMREDGACLDQLLLTDDPSMQATSGNAWHIPENINDMPAIPSTMRHPIYPQAGGALTLYAGSQYGGDGKAGNQLASGSRLVYRTTSMSTWKKLPLEFHGETLYNKYYKATIPADELKAGDVLEYYFRLPFSNFLPTHLFARDGKTGVTRLEDRARSEPYRVKIMDSTD